MPLPPAAAKKVATMEEAFDGADIVYPKSWAPFAAMEQRTKRSYAAGDQAGIDALEQLAPECPVQELDLL